MIARHLHSRVCPLAAALVLVIARCASAQFAVSDDDLQAIFRDRMSRESKDTGIVIAVVDQRGTRVFTAGTPGGRKLRRANEQLSFVRDAAGPVTQVTHYHGNVEWVAVPVSR